MPSNPRKEANASSQAGGPRASETTPPKAIKGDLVSLMNDLRQKPQSLSAASKYTTLNGIGYLAMGSIMVIWPAVTQTMFREPPFTGREGALMRVIGLTVVVIGWLYAAVRHRFHHRPVGFRSLGIGASRLNWCVYPPLFDVYDSRCVVSHGRVGVSCSRVNVRFKSSGMREQKIAKTCQRELGTHGDDD